MIALLLPLLLEGAVVAVHAEEERGVSAPEREALLGALSSALEARITACTVRQVAPGEVTCPPDQRCPDALRSLTSAGDILYVRIIGIPSTIRFIVERIETSGASRMASRDLPREMSAWRGEIDKIAKELFPEVVVSAPPVTRPPPAAPKVEVTQVIEKDAPPPAERSRVLPIALIGSGAGAVLVGTVFGIWNRVTINEGTSMVHDPMRTNELQSRTKMTGLVADIAYVVAVLCLAGGGILLAID